MNKVSFKQREAKHLALAVRADGNVLDLSGADLFFGVKKTKGDSAYIMSKVDTDFNKSEAAVGQVSIFLDSTDLDQEAGLYVAELKIEFLDGTVDKSLDLALVIEPAVT
jgi:hypothetical protein